jgi:hypothetical protein
MPDQTVIDGVVARMKLAVPPSTLSSLHINNKVMHFCAYLALSLLPVIGFRDRRRGLSAGLSMFVRGILMEAG